MKYFIVMAFEKDTMVYPVIIGDKYKQRPLMFNSKKDAHSYMQDNTLYSGYPYIVVAFDF